MEQKITLTLARADAERLVNLKTAVGTFLMG